MNEQEHNLWGRYTVFMPMCKVVGHTEWGLTSSNIPTTFCAMLAVLNISSESNSWWFTNCTYMGTEPLPALCTTLIYRCLTWKNTSEGIMQKKEGRMWTFTLQRKNLWPTNPNQQRHVRSKANKAIWVMAARARQPWPTAVVFHFCSACPFPPLPPVHL